MGNLLIFGTTVFAIAGGVWWMVSGHKPPLYFDLCWLTYCGFVLYVGIDSRITLWWERSKEIANDVQEIKRRVQSIESLIERYKRN